MSKGREYLEALLIAVIFLKFANTFVLQTFYIPSSSMEDTLLVGDHLFVNRFIYGPAASEWERRLLPLRPVRRGDVVIFRSVEDPAVDVVKRCIGLPGDTLEISAKQLYLNGERVEESSFVKHTAPGEQAARSLRDRFQARRRDNFGPLTVPEDHYFCLGDNRDRSNDSRFWGPLPAHFVKGRASVIYWSYDYGGKSLDTDMNLGERLGHWLSTAVGFFTHTRWRRTLHLVR